MEVVWIVTECSEGQHPNVNAFFDCAEAKKYAASSTATTVDMTWHKVVDSQLHELAMEFANAAADWFLAHNVLDAPWVQWDRMSQARAAFIAERSRANEQQ
jgi:hypothetical protein